MLVWLAAISARAVGSHGKDARLRNVCDEQLKPPTITNATRQHQQPQRKIDDAQMQAWSDVAPRPVDSPRRTSTSETGDEQQAARSEAAQRFAAALEGDAALMDRRVEK
jgi:hypothetical protein